MLISGILFFLTLGIVKVSVVLFYQRIFSSNRTFYISSYIMIGLLSIWALINPFVCHSTLHDGNLDIPDIFIFDTNNPSAVMRLSGETCFRCVEKHRSHTYNRHRSI